METKINIAAILKDKPQGTKLYDWLYNIDIELDTISTTDTETVVWCTNKTDNNTICHRAYSEFGTVRGCTDGLQILFPSKDMRDWSKFAWKKGDVLVSKGDKILHVIFEGFDDTYTTFKGKHYLCDYGDNEEYNEEEYNDYHKEASLRTIEFEKDNENAAQTYINTIEERFGGKLNLETLEIEKPQPEFKDGDILVNPSASFVGYYIFISKEYDKHNLNYYVAVDNDLDNLYFPSGSPWCEKNEVIRYATEAEKQQLFDALAKEGKRWNAERKIIEDAKKEYQFEPFGKVLARDSKDSLWHIDLYEGMLGDDSEYNYRCMASNWVYCIPYEGNEHLLGTTKDVEG